MLLIIFLYMLTPYVESHVRRFASYLRFSKKGDERLNSFLNDGVDIRHTFVIFPTHSSNYLNNVIQIFVRNDEFWRHICYRIMFSIGICDVIQLVVSVIQLYCGIFSIPLGGIPLKVANKIVK